MLIIKKSRVRTLDSNLPTILKDKSLMLAVAVAGQEKKVEKLGFTTPFTEGDSVLPRAVGPITRFNAYGRSVVLRNRPKEEVYHSAL